MESWIDDSQRKKLQSIKVELIEEANLPTNDNYFANLQFCSTILGKQIQWFMYRKRTKLCSIANFIFHWICFHKTHFVQNAIHSICLGRKSSSRQICACQNRFPHFYSKFIMKQLWTHWWQTLRPCVLCFQRKKWTKLTL